MTLAEKLRFLADRVEDGKEFYWGYVTMRINSENMIEMILNGEWIYAELQFNDIKSYDFKLKPQWEFTEDEKTILRNLPDEFRWIARDENVKHLYVYTDKPTNECKNWLQYTGTLVNLKVFRHLFQSIQWTDDEPCEFRRYL